MDDKALMMPSNGWLDAILGLVHFGLERPGTQPIPRGIIWPGLKSGLMWNDRSIRSIRIEARSILAYLPPF
jgi:hypothetical protein